MKKRIWLFASVVLLIGVLLLSGCSTARRPMTPTPGPTRTVPGPTRVTPPTNPTPGPTRTTPDPMGTFPSETPGPGTTTPGIPNTTGPGTMTPGSPGPGTTSPGTMNPGTTRPRTATPGTTPGTIRRTGTGTMGNRAKAIANEVAKDKNIRKASCVITGNTALIGVEFEKQYKGKVTDAIKKSVDRRVKKLEPSIKKVSVTADPDILSRIRSIASDTEKGKPLTGFADEIEEIIRRINPS